MNGGSGSASDPLEAEVLRDAFARETRRGVQLAVFGRLALFGLLWLSYLTDADWNLKNSWFQYRSALIAIALVSGVVNYLVSRRVVRPVPWSFGFFLVDAAVIAGLVFGWVPPAIEGYPQYLAVTLQDVMILAAILVVTVFPLSDRLIVFAGGSLLSVWLIGICVSFARTPGAHTDLGLRAAAQSWDDLLVKMSHPLDLMVEYVGLQTVLILALTALLILGVRRGRALVFAAVRAENESAFLARFFPPAVAAEIARRGADSLPSVRGEVAVLFADFARDPATTSDLDQLQAWYALVEQRVFEHGGLIDRFVGDPVMAVFGAATGDAPPATGPACADSALACAEALLADLKAAGFKGSAAGVNFGEVVSGEVGSERQRAFGVVGDTVNLARRMLDAARSTGGELAASDRLMRRLTGGAREGFTRTDGVAVRGQADPMTVWSR
jgi:adenylate cyclase